MPVHVGSNSIKDCKDDQDWGGKMLLDMLNSEEIVLLNNADLLPLSIQEMVIG